MLEVSLVKTKNPIYLPIKNSNSIGYVLRSRKNYKLKYMKKIIISTGIKIKEPQNLYVVLMPLFDDLFETPSPPLIYIIRKEEDEVNKNLKNVNVFSGIINDFSD